MKDTKECLKCKLDRLKKRVQELESELSFEQTRRQYPAPYIPFPVPIPIPCDPWERRYDYYYETTCDTVTNLLGNDQSSLLVT